MITGVAAVVSTVATPPESRASWSELFPLWRRDAIPYLFRVVELDLSPAPRIPPSRGERWFVLLSVGLFAGFLVAEVFRDFSTRKLGILFMGLAWAPMIAIHELGHVLVARLVGWRVTDMVVGFGRELMRFRVGEMRVYVQLAPLGGYVTPAPRDLSLPRLKSALIFASGPGAEALVALALYMADPELFTGPETVLRVAMRAVCYVVGISLFFNLVPMPMRGGVNDGLGILSSLGMHGHHLRARLIAPEQREIVRRLVLEDPRGALEMLREARHLHGDDPRLLALSAVALVLDCRKSEAQELLERADAEARSQFRSQSDASEHSDDSRVTDLHAFRAWTFLEMEDPGLRSFALREARQAFVRSGGDVLPSVLFGRALLAQGQNRKAYGALMFGFKRASLSEEEGLCVAYLAIAAHRALAAREPRTPGTPYIAPDHPGRFFDALERFVVGKRLKHNVLQELERYRYRRQRES